jgi:hypothetical protein
MGLTKINYVKLPRLISDVYILLYVYYLDVDILKKVGNLDCDKANYVKLG